VVLGNPWYFIEEDSYVSCAMPDESLQHSFEKLLAKRPQEAVLRAADRFHSRFDHVTFKTGADSLNEILNLCKILNE